MSDTRLVPMTREMRDAIGDIGSSGYAPVRFLRAADAVVAAFDAAPADPAEAIDNAVFDAEDDYEITDAVLRALGYPEPDASEPRA